MKREADDSLQNGDGVKKCRTEANLVERNPAPSGCPLVNTHRVGQHDVMDLISLASEIQNADVALNNQSGKITLILDQIRFLQSQARDILKDMRNDQHLHRAACNFKKVPGKVYYLYVRESGQAYFSMLSPQEWGPNLTHTFVGGYRLELDQTWTPVDRINDVDQKKLATKQILQSTNLFKTLRSIDHNEAELMDII